MSMAMINVVLGLLATLAVLVWFARRLQAFLDEQAATVDGLRRELDALRHEHAALAAYIVEHVGEIEVSEEGEEGDELPSHPAHEAVPFAVAEEGDDDEVGEGAEGRGEEGEGKPTRRGRFASKTIH